VVAINIGALGLVLTRSEITGYVVGLVKVDTKLVGNETVTDTV